MDIPNGQPDFLSQEDVNNLMLGCNGSNLDDPEAFLQMPISEFTKICRSIERRNKIAMKEVEETGLESVGAQTSFELSDQITETFSFVRCYNSFIKKEEYWYYVSSLGKRNFNEFSNECRIVDENAQIYYVRLWLLIQDLKKYIPMDRKMILRKACQKIFKNGEDFNPFNFTQRDFWRCVAGVYPLPLTKDEAEESLIRGMAIRHVRNPMMV